MLETIAELWLKGTGHQAIAKALGVDRKTIEYHLVNSIRPLWAEQMRSRLDEDMAKVALIERTAWAAFNNQNPGETQKIVEKALLEGGSKPRIVKEVMRQVTKTGEAAWLQIVQWCIEHRAKIFGHYAPTRHHVDTGGDLRVAGKTPSEVDAEMVQRIMDQVKARRKYQAALDAGRN